ncbi:MAG TPA: dihydrodipicolinate synthase family protein [Candidatus Baltobacteraceae bacterium]
MIDGLRGVCAAVLTPFDAGYRPDVAVAVPYYDGLLRSGCSALNVMGTTGEANSIAIADRLAYLEAIAQSGLPLERMMAGTGAASLRDAIALTRKAHEAGFAAALVMPPFFYRGISDDGVERFFDALFDAVQPPASGILLYNFPKMSGITFTPDLVDRLIESYPGLIAGMKDSSNDVALQNAVIERHPDLLIYPGSEVSLRDARERGCAGCISASVALWPEIAAQVWRGEVPQEELTSRRASLAELPMIPAVRYLLWRKCGEPDWERVVPPQIRLTKEQIVLLHERLALEVSL